MASSRVRVSVLGTAQDGGLPQAGCDCQNCLDTYSGVIPERMPVSLGIEIPDGRNILVEASKDLARQLHLWSRCEGKRTPIIPDGLVLTHTHLGHIEGIGQFGKEAMGVKNIPLLSSESVFNYLSERGSFKPFVRADEKEFNGIIQLVKVPHRDEYSDTHAIVVRGETTSLLFLPDHDSWKGTLEENDANDIREWLKRLDIQYALIDATFWDLDELSNRDMSEIPHPTIQETLNRLGKRRESDPEIHFIHLNHTNPVIRLDSKERHLVENMGWSISNEGQVFDL